jgi:DNA-binding LacI/PurR family transcriptional regulator
LEILKKVARDKLIIIDNKINNLKGAIEIYQDFEEDIYNSLKWYLPKVKKYKRFIITYRKKSVYPYPLRILNGFRKFCVEVDMDFEIIDEIYDDMILKEGDLFLVLDEGDLVKLIKQARKNRLVLGRDLGIIGYKETPLKELLNISVVSANCSAMGEKAADMLLNKVEGSMINPFVQIERPSL